MKKSMAVFALAITMFGAGLGGSRALAKCSKDCKRVIAADFTGCKSTCAKGKAGKACKSSCKDRKKSDKAACKAATNPVPPSCGVATSPAGAFVD